MLLFLLLWPIPLWIYISLSFQTSCCCFPAILNCLFAAAAAPASHCSLRVQSVAYVYCAAPLVSCIVSRSSCGSSVSLLPQSSERRVRVLRRSPGILHCLFAAAAAPASHCSLRVQSVAYVYCAAPLVSSIVTLLQHICGVLFGLLLCEHIDGILQIKYYIYCDCKNCWQNAILITTL